MRLLRVIRRTNPESGGPIEALLRSSEALIRAGHEIEIVSLESKEDIAGRSFPFPIVALGAGVGRYGYNPHLTPWIRENAKRFDAVVLHGLWNYSSFGAWRGLRKQSTPYYIFVHGMMDPWFRKAHPLKHVAKLLYWWIGEGRVLRDAAAVLFTSEEEEVRARRSFYGHSYKKRVVRYGSAGPVGDAETAKMAFKKAFPALNGKRFLLFLSRIHPKKGCDLLIRAFANSVDQIAPDLELAIAGPDQVGWAKELKALSENIGVSNRIHWLGMLQGELKWGAFHSAEAMILPSHQENFGIVIAEAMACSTPVLISDKVNIWREVQATNGGFVQADTQEGTQNLIRQFCALSSSERLQMGNAARHGFLNYFEASAAAHDFAKVIGFSFDRDRQTVAQPRKFRVLQVIHSTDSESGGPLEALVRSSELLLRDGHEIEVVSLEAEEDVAKRSFPFQVTALGRGVSRYGYNPRLERWIGKNAERFDALVLHGLWNYSSIGTWRGLRNKSTPYFIYAHGMMDPWFRRHYPLKHVAKLVYWWLLEGRVLRDASGVLFTCEEERLLSRNIFYGHKYKECVMHFGTADPVGNAERESAAFLSAHPALKGRRYLLFLSRIHPKKGCDLLVRAFAKAIEDTSMDCDLVIAGPDQVGWVPELQRLAKKLGIGNKVHWLGMLRGEIKWGAFRSADAVVLPSHQENFGFVVAEAMACSTPVLISNKVNIWREVNSSQGGLVEPDTLEGTLNLIRRFWALSAEERVQMKLAARQGFLCNFDVECMVQDLLKLIDLAGHKRVD
jgi:glycosyltransferase involved in cell wall biosynthesis